ncbi:DUF418 domain-containing protein [Herbidospora mongoliensis]|uniref:DUF418 domain-containing protein n=1 Tax=Herbidospora mongoliensis TaxID=688067 RepID=UPI00082E116A|nr:DUF418 domain-containing protein [Herbidospora mongoliensis]
MARQSPRPRIVALDVIRGFALCGILVANVRPIATTVGLLPPDAAPPSTADLWLGLLVDHRFFPVFSLLFGMGFSLLYESAVARGVSPRLVLLRRLVALFLLGLAHRLLWDGDILAIYAVVGLVVLLPSSWLPRRAVAGLSVVALGLALFFGGGIMVVPGLFLLGSALVRYGVADRLESSTRIPVIVGAVALVPAVVLGHLQSSDANLFTAAGLATATVYFCVFLLLLRSPLRGFLYALLTPLGRMALTNYLTATVLVLALSKVIGGTAEDWSTGTVLGIAGVIMGVQWVWSTLWLRRFRQGPIEYVWRLATWPRDRVVRY